MGKIIGIDLGNSVLRTAVRTEEGVVLIPAAGGENGFPSAVAFAKTGEQMTGRLAKRQALLNPQRSFTSLRSALGRGEARRMDGRTLRPQELAAALLREAKKQAEEHLGEDVSAAVLSVPACADDALCQAMRESAKLAGLRVHSLICDPLAAALACSLQEREGETILCCDLGGRSCSVSLLQVRDGRFRLLAARSADHLGGDEYDRCLVNWVLEHFRKEQHLDLSKDPAAMQRILEAAEETKICLSSSLNATISLPYITAAKGEALHLEYELSRPQFSGLTAHLSEGVAALITETLRDAGMDPGGLSRLLLIGGGAHIPAVREAARRAAGREPLWNVDPDGCVALGAALSAGSPDGQNLPSLFPGAPLPAGA